MKVQKGDRILILQDRLSSANVGAGDILEVTGRVNDHAFITESPRNPSARGWWFADSSEGEGWVRVDP